MLIIINEKTQPLSLLFGLTWPESCYFFKKGLEKYANFASFEKLGALF